MTDSALVSACVPDSDWAVLAAGVLGMPSDDVQRHASTVPFLSMGGTSLRATAFAALVERASAVGSICTRC